MHARAENFDFHPGLTSFRSHVNRALISLVLEIVFSTAHKAKGLEFDTVRLGEDFLQDRPLGELGKISLVSIVDVQ